MIDLKKIRTEAGMTQAELATQTGVIRQTICEIERGRNKPSVDLAKRLACVLNIDWIAFFTDRMP